jgi:hypothetical protein
MAYGNPLDHISQHLLISSAHLASRWELTLMTATRNAAVKASLDSGEIDLSGDHALLGEDVTSKGWRW